jgi:hypothetical protein
MKTYRLGSSGLVYAPGVVAWAINGYAFKRDRKSMRDVIAKTWSVPNDAADALLSKKVPYTIDDEAVVFEVPCSA